MATVRTYDVVINSRYNAGGVKAGVEEQTKHLNAVERLQIKHQQTVEKLQLQTDAKLSQIEKLRQRQEQERRQKHAQNLQTIYQRSLSEQTKILTRDHEKRQSQIRNYQQSLEKGAIQHAQKMELIERRAQVKLTEIQQREGQKRQTKQTSPLGQFGDLFSNVQIGGVGLGGFGKAGVAVAAAKLYIDAVVGAMQQYVKVLQHVLPASLEAASSFQQLRNQFIGVTGSSAEAEHQISGLRETLNNTNAAISLRDAAQGSLRLQAAGVEAATAEKAILGLAKASQLYGATADNLNAVLFNLTQIKGVGKVTGDELKETLGRIPGLIQVINKEFGSLGNVRGLGADEFINRFAKGLGNLQGATSGVNTAWIRFYDAVDQAYVRLGDPALPGVASILDSVTGFLQDNQEEIGKWGVAFGRNIENIRDLINSELIAYLGFFTSKFAGTVRDAAIAINDFRRSFYQKTRGIVDQAAEFAYYMTLGRIGYKREGLTGVDDFATIGAGLPDTFQSGRSNIFGSVDTQQKAFKGVFERIDRARFEEKLFDENKVKKPSKTELQDRFINYYANQAGIDPDFVRAVIQQESGGRFSAVSPKGAGGLMQLMPGTARQLGVTNRFDPQQNIAAGVEYLRQQIAEFGSFALGLAAYNAGPGAVRKYKGIPPYKETKEYVQKILNNYQRIKLGADKDVSDPNTFALSFAFDPKVYQSGLYGGIPITATGEAANIARGRGFGALPSSLSVSGRLKPQGLPQFPFTVDEQFRSDILGTQAERAVGLETRRKNIDAEKFASIQRVSNDLTEEATNLEIRLDTLRRTSGDAEFTRRRQSNQARQEEVDLLEESVALNDQIALTISSVNSAQRIENQLNKDYLEILGREEGAIKSINKSQLELSQQTVYSQNQVNAQVADFLASQKSVNEVIGDFKIGIIQSSYDALDRALGKVTQKLGVMGDLLKDVLSGFIKLALNNVFQRIFLGQGPVAQGAGGGGGFNLGNILFGGGGTGGGIFTGNQGGGIFNLGSGVTSTPVAGFDESFALQQLANKGFNIPSSQTTGSASGSGLFGNLGGLFKNFNLKGLGSAFGSVAPFLGAGLGGQFGGVLGGIGGALGGLVTSSLGIFGGAGFASLGLLGPAALIAAPLLLIGGHFLQRNKLRRQEEKVRNQAILDAFAQIDRVGTDIEKDIRADRLDGASGLNQFRQQSQSIRDQYVEQMSQLKDKKTRSHALRDVSRIDTKITENTARIEAAINAQSVRQSRVATFSPTFATGGYVGSAFNGRVPGVYDRRDDKLIRVSGNEVVLNPRQYAPLIPYMQAAKVPGFANGGATGSSPVTPAISFQMIVTKDDSGNITKAEAVKITPDGKREILGTILRDIESPSGAIVAAITNQQNRRRNGGKL